MITPAADIEMINLHLAEISTQVQPGARAVLVCDGAGWHQRGKNLRLPHNIRLVSRPPYSPELNPMEKVWAYLRQNKLCAAMWDSYDDIPAACVEAWNWFVAEPARITSIGTGALSGITDFYRAEIFQRGCAGSHYPSIAELGFTSQALLVNPIDVKSSEIRGVGGVFD